MTQSEIDARKKIDLLLLDVDELIKSGHYDHLPHLKIYRQALTEVTKQKGFPDNIIWPEAWI